MSDVFENKDVRRAMEALSKEGYTNFLCAIKQLPSGMSEIQSAIRKGDGEGDMIPFPLSLFVRILETQLVPEDVINELQSAISGMVRKVNNDAVEPGDKVGEIMADAINEIHEVLVHEDQDRCILVIDEVSRDDSDRVKTTITIQGRHTMKCAEAMLAYTWGLEEAQRIVAERTEYYEDMFKVGRSLLAMAAAAAANDESEEEITYDEFLELINGDDPSGESIRKIARSGESIIDGLKEAVTSKLVEELIEIARSKRISPDNNESGVSILEEISALMDGLDFFPE